MATLTTSSKNFLGAFTPTQLALSASDTFTYTQGAGQELYLYNATASPVAVTLDGAGGTTVAVPGAGATTFDVSAGLAITVAANDWKVVKLDTIPAYLQGTIALTGGTGVKAILVQ